MPNDPDDFTLPDDVKVDVIGAAVTRLIVEVETLNALVTSMAVEVGIPKERFLEMVDEAVLFGSESLPEGADEVAQAIRERAAKGGGDGSG